MFLELITVDIGRSMLYMVRKIFFGGVMFHIVYNDLSCEVMNILGKLFFYNVQNKHERF